MKPGNKLKGKDFYKKMLDAKKAKADKIKKNKPVIEEDHKTQQNPLSQLPEKPARIEVTESTYMSKMEENTSTSAALEKALNRIAQQARGL